MGDFALPTGRPTELGPRERLSSDEWLAGRVSKGSMRAFAVLYGRHHQALYRYCRSIVRDDDDAQDALQSSMMRALAALQARERDLAVRPWLFRIVHNEAVSLLRRRRSNSSPPEELEPADDGIEHTVQQRARFAGLISDLQMLAERQRAALVMRELSGLSIEEIAAALSTSPGAAKQAVFEARCALREFEEGRAMDCEAVRRAISDGDRRVLRARKIRAHVRACRGCRDFEGMIGRRTAELHALAPALPAAAATAMLARLLGHGAAGGHSVAAAASSGAALGNHAAASVGLKALAGVAIVTAATAGTVHLASSPDSHGRVHPPARRGAPVRSGEPGAVESAQGGIGSSAPLRRGVGAKLSLTPIARSGHAPAAAEKALAGAATPIEDRQAAAKGGGTHRHRGASGGSSTRAARPRSGSPHPRAGHAHRSPKPAPPAPRRTGKEVTGQTSAPGTEPSSGHAGLSHAVKPVPRSEAPSQVSPPATTG